MAAATCFSVLAQELTLSERKRVGIERILQRYAAEAVVAGETSSAPKWDASFYGYDKSSIFQNLKPSQQIDLLKESEERILREIQLIEVAGMAFASRMATLAPTVEQRELYSLFAGDEARHFQMVSALVGRATKESAQNNSFLAAIGGLIDSETPNPLVFFIQVILEGWGIHYYGSLSRSCQDPKTRDTLNAIIKDEASHHGSGILLFSENSVSSEEEARIHGTVDFFLESIRVGPLSVVEALARANRGMSLADITLFLREVRFEEKIARDLQYIRTMLQKSDAERLLAALEAKNTFALPGIEECAAKIARAISA